MRRGLGACLLVLLACRKQPVQEAPQLHGAAFELVPHGFHRVEPACVLPGTVATLPISQAGSVQDVALLDHFTPHVAADASFVYWVDGRVIKRAERAAEPWGWTVTELERSESPIRDFAVTDLNVYWTTPEIDGHTAIRMRPKHRGAERVAALEWGGIPKMVAKGGSLFWLSPRDGVHELLDDGLQLTQREPGALATTSVLAIDETNLYVSLPKGFVRIPRREPRKSVPLALAADVVAAASDGTFLYWLERGEAGVPERECRACSTGYEMTSGTKPSFAHGRLRRVSVRGGAVVDLATELPEVESIHLDDGIVWIPTGRGLLRLDPAREHPAPVVVAPESQGHGQIVAFGGALALAAEAPRPRIVLLGSP